jgi:hypothetical protein
MNSLPVELISLIAEFLDINSFINFARTNKYHKDICMQKKPAVFGSHCYVCERQIFKFPTITLLCTFHPTQAVRSHKVCWQKWQEKNVSQITTDLNCVISGCKGIVFKYSSGLFEPSRVHLQDMLYRARNKAFKNNLRNIVGCIHNITVRDLE